MRRSAALPGITRSRRGFTLIEMVITVSLLGLFVSVVSISLLGVARRHAFKATVQDLIRIMQTAAFAAAETGRYYELILDLPEQTYTLREVTNADLSEVLPEEIIEDGMFSPAYRVPYVQFDDGAATSEARAKFRVGPRGWQYGGKIVVLDRDDRPYTILVSRLNRTVKLVQGDAGIAMPLPPEMMRF